jgi:hypothetical protein
MIRHVLSFPNRQHMYCPFRSGEACTMRMTGHTGARNAHNFDSLFDIMRKPTVSTIPLTSCQVQETLSNLDSTLDIMSTKNVLPVGEKRRQSSRRTYVYTTTQSSRSPSLMSAKKSPAPRSRPAWDEELPDPELPLHSCYVSVTIYRNVQKSRTRQMWVAFPA